MRFFVLSLLVAGAFAADEKCNDTDGDLTTNLDTYVCPTHYTAKTDLNIMLTTPGNTADTTADCCDADSYTAATVTIAGTVTAVIPNSNYATATKTYTYPAPALACDYLTPVNTVTGTLTYANDGSVTLTIADTADPDTAATAICTAPPTYPATTAVVYAGTVTSPIANSNYDSATMGYTYPAPALTCICGVTPVNTVSATVTALNGLGQSGSITVTVADTADPDTAANAICPAADLPVYIAAGQCYTDATKTTTTTESETDCTGGTLTWRAAVTTVVTGPIANSNYAANTLDYTCGSLPVFACDEGYTAVDTVTVTAATTNNTTGAVTVTITDTATTATLAADVCVADANEENSPGARTAATAAAVAAGVAAIVL